jgi:hypothetical protein
MPSARDRHPLFSSRIDVCFHSLFDFLFILYLFGMIQLRFVYFVMSASAILGAQSVSILNRASPRSVPSTALEAARNSTTSTITSPEPHAVPARHSTRNVHAEMQMLPRDSSPTPAPTGLSQESTTVHISDPSNFAILLPKQGSRSTFSFPASKI